MLIIEKYSMLKLFSICSLVLLFAFFTFTVNGEDIENEQQYRLTYTASIELPHDLSFDLTPELRLNDDFGLNRFQNDAGFAYSPFKGFSVSSYYRFMLNSNYGKEPKHEISHSAMANLAYKTKIERFRPSVRLRYMAALGESNPEHLFRYKGALKYNIKKSDISPGIAFEVFHLLETNVLEKYRTAIFVEYEINKNNCVAAEYKFDYFKTEYLNRHIFQVVYEMKF